MKKIYSCLTCLALTLALTACGNNQQSSEPGKAKEKTASVTAPADKAAPEAAAPAKAPAGEAAAPGAVKGKVAETMDASGYTYIRLDDGSGKEVWAAAPKTELKVGEEITLQGGSVMENFNSKTLNKTFEKIIFATGVSRGDSQEVAPGAAAGSFGDAVKKEGAEASSGSAGNVVPFSDLKVAKAAGPDGHAVGEMFDKAATLDKKNVAVKGQVVKVSKNIMGKNWLHIQDGTGDPNKNTHDLVVTTMETAEKGDIVTVEGPAAAAKDFGSGYKYDIIIEDAKVTKAEKK